MGPMGRKSPRDPMSQLSDIDFLAIRNIIYESSGVFCDNKLVLKHRLVRRMSELQIDDFRRYYLYLKFDPTRDDELELLLQEIVVNETYFYREKNQLQAFEKEILPRLLELRPDGPIRIWSAGCSSGEEPYTLAMILTERGYYERMEISIFATDISSRALGKAREGIFSRNSFRGDEMGPWMKYFEVEGDTYRLDPELRRKVLFRKHNLLDDNAYNPLRGLDVIFCRNVMIYFDRPAKRKVVRMFHDRLRTNGFLLLGHAESLTGLSDGFKLERLQHDLVYRRLEEGRS